MQCGVALLGGFAVTVDGRELPANVWRHRRALELVKILALARNHRMATEQVIDLLWPDLSPPAGGANLRKAAHFARTALGAADAVVLSDGVVALFPGAGLEVDAEVFERAADTAADTADTADTAADAWRHAIALYGGELLPEDRYAEWAAGPRERLRLKYLEGLRRLRMWERLAEEEPLDEEAHRGLMRRWLDRGNRHAAVRAFDRLQDALGRELGVRPSPETLALWNEIRSTPSVAPAATPLVGRDQEIERALARWEEARSGHGGVLLISGEAGIGKSRTCAELARLARAEGAVVVAGAARPEEASSPFAVVLAAVEAASSQHPALAGALGPERTERGGSAGPAWLEAATPGAGQQRMFSSVARAVTGAASGSGLMLVLDDLQHADDGSLQLLTYLGRIAPYHRVLLVLSHRSEILVPELAALRSTLLQGSRTTDLRLCRLTPDAVADLVAAASAGRASRAAVESIGRLGEGNPFYCEELATAIDADGNVEIPDRLYEVATVRLDRLRDPVREGLQRVAVTGDHFTADELVAVLGVDDGTAYQYLDEAIHAGVIDEHDTGYRFRHTLLRRALERAVPRHRRRRIHADLAERLGATGTDPARVAYHLAEAGQVAATVPWLEKAVAQAAALGSYGDALRLAGDATARATAPADIARVLALRADLLYVTGDPAAVVAYDAALATAPSDVRPRLSLMKARALLTTGDVAGAGHTADLAGAVTPEDRTAAAVIRGHVAWAHGDIDGAERSAWTARDLAIASGLTAELGEATELLGLVAHSRGLWRDRVRYELTDTAQRPEDVAGSVFDAHLCLAEYLLYGQQPYDQVIDFATELRATAVRSGTGRGEAFATCLLGEAELLSGRLPEARDHLERAAGLHEAVAASAGQALSLQRLAEAALAGGDPRRATMLLEDAERVAQGCVLEQHLLGKIYGTMVQAQADPRKAMAVVDRAEARMSDQPLCEPCAMGFFVAAATAAARVGDLGRARAYLTRAQDVSAHWPGGGWHAAVLEAQATTAVAAGEPEVATRLLEQAAATFEQAGQRLDAERCRRAAAA